MFARDWFESIRERVLEVEAMEAHVEELKAKAGPRAQGFESGGRGGTAGDASAPILDVVDADAELDRARAKTNSEIDRALLVLYGRSGHGGLAKARDITDADILCAYYLMGMSWPSVALELSSEESVSPKHWCIMRARRALEYLDYADVEELQRS